MVEKRGDLIGRASECDRIATMLNSERSTAASLVIRGLPGVGKSALLEWAVDRTPERVVLRASGSGRSLLAPFSTLQTLLGPAIAPGNALATDRFNVALRVFEQLSAAADARPVMVVVDDAQWADRSSLDALLGALPRLENDNITMLFAQRVGEPCALDEIDLPTLKLEGLSGDDACELLAGTVIDRVARELARHTAGNPLAMLELAANLDIDQRMGRVPLSPWLLESPTVEAGFSRRVDRLPPGPRAMLELAAMEDDIELTVLTGLGARLGLDADAIAYLTGRQFLEVDNTGQVLQFAHPLLRSAVYRGIDPSRRRQTHRQVASMLRRDDDVIRRAWHLAGAADSPGDEVAAADELDRAGEYSRARCAYAVAAEAFERSANLTSDSRQRTDRLFSAGDTYWLAGQVERSAEVLDVALRLTTDQIQRADVQLKRISTQRMRPTDDMFDELVAEAEATLPVDSDRAAMLFAQSVMTGMMGKQLDRATRSAERALELIAPTNPMRLFAQILHALVTDLTGSHRDGLPVFRDFTQTFDTFGAGPQFAGFAEYTAFSLLAGDEVDTACGLLDAMIEYARRERVLGLLPTPLTVRAEVSWRCGQWANALAEATESLAIVEETDQFLERAHSLMILGKIHGGFGRINEARAGISRALELAEARRSAGLLYMGRAAIGFAELSAGDVAEARRHLLGCREYARTSGTRNPTIWPWPIDLVEAAWLLGDGSLARSVSVQLEADAEIHGSRQAAAFAARCRGLVAVDPLDVRLAFEEAQAYFDDAPFVFERARTHLLFGQKLVEVGCAVDADRELHAALEIFDELGAHPWSERTRSHIETRAAISEPNPIERLTARELQIALAASTGKVNAEIAGDLFLSRRTVEHHLGAIYRKLELRNRTQLAALVNEHRTVRAATLPGSGMLAEEDG